MKAEPIFLRWQTVFSALCLTFSIYMILSFVNAGLIADDSYIVARYAANFVTIGEIVYNSGERVNAITSPMLLAIYIVLTVCFPDTDPVVLFSRISILCFLSTCILAALFLRRRRPEVMFTFLTLFSTSPFYFFWMTGGLETPLLALVIFGASLKFLGARSPHSLARSPGFGVLIACGILARYESILFFLPVLLCVLRSCLTKRDIRGCMALSLFSGSLPCLWLIFCHFYYGSFLPTSFSKTGTAFSLAGLGTCLAIGSIYVYEFLIYTGFLFFGCALLIWQIVCRSKTFPPPDTTDYQKANSSVVWLGVFLFLGYGCLFSTVHMMYSYRMLVPLIPVLALLISLSLEDVWTELERARASLIAVGGIIFILILSLNAVNFTIILKSSLNPSRIGEFRGMWDIRSYFSELQRAGDAIKDHWDSNQGSARCPVVQSPNEGYFAYKFVDWIIVGGSLTDRTVRMHVNYYVVEENIHDQSLKTKPYQIIYRGKAYNRVSPVGNMSRILVFWNPDGGPSG